MLISVTTCTNRHDLKSGIKPKWPQLLKSFVEFPNESSPLKSNGSGGGRGGRGRGGGPIAAGLPVAVEESPADQQVYVNLADG